MYNVEHVFYDGISDAQAGSQSWEFDTLEQARTKFEEVKRAAWFGPDEARPKGYDEVLLFAPREDDEDIMECVDCFDSRKSCNTVE